MNVVWGEFHPESLLGANDPYELTALQPGETIMYCENCGLGYHRSTVDLLRQHHGGRCAGCTMPNRWGTFTLPGASPVSPAPEKNPVTPIGTIVKLDRIWEHVGEFVTFEGYVHRVQQSRSTGTWFVLFEDTRSPLEGFRLVIYNGYARHWAAAGLDINDYARKVIRVRGLIRNDPMWGIQMLIDRPEVISIVDDGKGAAIEDGEDPVFPPDPVDDGPVTQRIIWKV